YEPSGADDAERAREAGADDQHHHGADDSENNLGLDDRRLPARRAFPARPEREHARQSGGDWQARQRVLAGAGLLLEWRRALEHVDALRLGRRVERRLLREDRYGEDADERTDKEKSAQAV